MNSKQYLSTLEDVNELMHNLADQRDQINEYDNYANLQKTKLSNYMSSLQLIYDNIEDSKNVFVN